MTKLSVFAVVLVLFAGTAAMLRTDRTAARPVADSAILAGSAPFRDGLYLGRFAARRGEPMHIASGRWVTPADRNLFVIGFEHGYQEQATRASAPIEQQAR